MTKERILSGLKKCAKKLGRTPTYTEIWRMKKITKTQIKLQFENLAEALRRAGVVARGVGYRLDTLTLLEDWGHMVRKMGRPPSFMEYKRAGNYGANSFLNRCGAWSRVGERFCAEVKERKKESAWADVLEIVKQWEGKTTAEGRRKMKPTVSERVPHDEARAAAEDAAGASDLRAAAADDYAAQRANDRRRRDVLLWDGSGTTGVRRGTHPDAFPDCEALREVAPGKWQRVKAEVEVFSRSFQDHQHDPKGCDMIICWVHNWPECPEWIEVIELSKVVKQIGWSGDRVIARDREPIFTTEARRHGEKRRKFCRRLRRWAQMKNKLKHGGREGAEG